ncbi:amino acid permease/ SLC12A domain-containing protein [Chytriomyces sp. MP71]|nr:amino acid permease/ SLC12A domain-containing protein [Chytriomyces sp. MP71]
MSFLKGKGKVVETKAVDPEAGQGAPQGGKLHRKLQARHLEMIAIGGTIGTGLLLRSGRAIAHAGPVGTLLCFALVGLQVFGVASSIGEMATYIPVEGAFSAFPARFVNRALGFAAGWNYWFVWALTFPCEMAGISALMSYWIDTSRVASWVWSLVYMVPLVAVNLVAVTGFAETEFVLCFLKVIAICLFIIIGICVWFGAGKDGNGPIGFKNWNPAIAGATPLQQFLNVGGTFTTAFFSYGGTELVGLTAGEAANPRKSVPRAINGTFYRIVIFYLVSLFLVGVILSPDSPILKAKSIKESPFVYVYSQVGIQFGADFMNAVIIISATSAANSSLYACARTLLRLAEEGNAPRIFSRVDKRGVPVNSVLAVTAVGLIAVIGAFASGKDGSGHVFDWLSGVISLGIMINWMIMSFTHLRFRWGFIAQGRDLKDLPYLAPFFPWADYLSLLIGSVVVVFLIVSAFYTNGVSNDEFFALQWFMDNAWTYSGVPLVILAFLGHATFVSEFALVRYEDMDMESDRYFESAEETAENEALKQKPKNLKEWGQKIWFKLF